MALTTVKDFYGWETGGGYGISATGAYVLDGTARTGCYYGKCLPITSSGTNFTRTITPIQVVGSTTASLMVQVRVFIRIAVAPNQNGVGCVDISKGIYVSPDIASTLQINSNLTWQFTNSFFTPVTVTGGTALSLNTWYEVMGLVQIERCHTAGNCTGPNGALTNGFDRATLSYTVNGQTLSNNKTIGNIHTSSLIIDRVILGRSSNVVGGVTVGEFHYDDLVIVAQADDLTLNASVTLPTAKRVRLLRAEGQGADAAWTGPYTDVQEVPLSAGGAGQTSAVAGQATTFTHAGFANFGFGAVEALKIYAHVKESAGGTTTHQIRLNGVDYPVPITTAYQSGVNTPMAVDWSSYAAGAFDGAEFGFVNSTGAALTLGAIHGEVLYTEGATSWTGCNAPTGVDPGYAPDSPGACIVTMSPGTDSGGGSGCQPVVGPGTDSGGGSGCAPTL